MMTHGGCALNTQQQYTKGRRVTRERLSAADRYKVGRSAAQAAATLDSFKWRVILNCGCGQNVGIMRM